MVSTMFWRAGAAVLALAAVASPASAQVALNADRVGAWGYDLTGRNMTVKPGDSFFDYANGAYLTSMQIPADRTWYGTVNILRDLSERRVHGLLGESAVTAPLAPAADDNRGKVGAFYRSFMDAAAVEALDAKPLQPGLDAIRGAADHAQLAAVMGRAQRSFHYSLFALQIFTDLKDPDRNAVYVDQGGLGLPDRDYYLESGFAAKKQAYEAYVAKMLGMIGWANPAGNAKAIVDFETKVAQASWTRAEGRNLDKLYNPMTVAQLATYAPGFDWKGWMAAGDLGKRENVIALSNTALPKLAALYAATPLDQLQAYMAFHYANNASGVLSSRFVDAAFDFSGKTLSGQEALPARWKRGVRAVSNAMGQAIGQTYVEKYFGPEAKAQTQAMVDNLKAAYRVRINGLDWMSPATKAKALEKLAAMDVQIGYPTVWNDYRSLNVRADDLFGNAERGIAWAWEDSLRDLDKPVDRAKWGTTPQTVNAFNDGTANKLLFPAAFMQAPNFDPLADPAVNYGALGAVIGHEISHGFDDQGRKFDSRGRLTDWWTADDARKFVASSKAFGAQYERFPIFPDLKINGDLTMGENIADLGGILAAYDAYKASLGGKPAPVIDGYTGDQRFFLGYAQYYRNKARDDFMRQLMVSDPHSPFKARVDVVLPNVDAWYKAFNIKPGDKMYLPPSQRIRVW